MGGIHGVSKGSRPPSTAPAFPAYGGSDTLWGGSGQDILYGGTGNDFFFTKETGQAEIDLLYGEAGTDWAQSPATGFSDRDTIDSIPNFDIEVT